MVVNTKADDGDFYRFFRSSCRKVCDFRTNPVLKKRSEHGRPLAPGPEEPRRIRVRVPGWFRNLAEHSAGTKREEGKINSDNPLNM